ncbi:MAG: hypothetical protein RRC34_09645 [Lentisphaeria bacterium]|nr:hypothetical protein [Lentisphaeria bacterium]
MRSETIHINSLPSEAEAILRDYTRLQRQEKEIREEKLRLRQRLDVHLPHQAGHETIWSELDGDRVKISRVVKTRVDYDEELLKKRLGGAYREILSPDLSRIRRKMRDIRSVFTPVLDIIGAPDPSRVREALNRGIVSPKDFAGAYDKKDEVSIAVTVCHKKQVEQGIAAPRG